MKMTREEIKQEIDIAEKTLYDLLEERQLLLKKYPCDSKHRGTWSEAIQQHNELSSKIKNAYNKLNHLTQIYFNAEE